MGIIMAKLSGWKRLWLVLAVIYLIPVAALTVGQIPKKSGIMRQWAIDVIEVDKNSDSSISNVSTLEILSLFEKRGHSYQDIINKLTDVILKGIEDKDGSKWVKLADKLKLKELREQYTEKLANLNRDRVRIAGIGFLFWIVPVVIVYILGLTVKWIYMGFKTDYSKNNNNQ